MKSLSAGAEAPAAKKAMLAAAAFALLLTAYLVLCAAAAGSSAFFPNSSINGVEVSGLDAADAAETVSRALAQGGCAIYLSDAPKTPAASVSYTRLGLGPDSCTPEAAEALLRRQRSGSFFTGGFRLLRSFFTRRSYPLTPQKDEAIFSAAVEELAAQLSTPPQDTACTLEGETVHIIVARDGRRVSAEQLRRELEKILGTKDACITLEVTRLSAKALTAQEIYDRLAREVKNAAYDAATKSILAEQTGVFFSVNQTAALLRTASPGDEISLPAEITQPSITAEHLRQVLFRDVLGSYTTQVSGTAERITNVRLSAAAFDGTVLNSGDVFSYNGVVGERTAEKGYRPAPAYVGGETVDEIGGGVCQPSSTLYVACLLANLQIVERYAHRYVPAYVPKGLDATVSWNGPDYKFCNNTDYPIRISASYSNGRLSVKLLGTKESGSYVKMTSEILSTTAWKTVYEQDTSLPPGTTQVKVTPYTGCRVRTFRNLYSSDGTLLSSTPEATSDYKSRDKVVLQGPSLPEGEAASGGAALPEGTQAFLPQGGEALRPDESAADQSGADPETGGTPDSSEPDTPLLPDLPVFSGAQVPEM